MTTSHPQPHQPATAVRYGAAHDAVDAALRALRDGKMVLVTDDADRENEGDLVMAARHTTTTDMAFFLRHTSGIICAPMPTARADTLRLPAMVEDNTDSMQTAFTVSVDHHSVGTGISAADRATTVRALADPTTSPPDLRRPGHVFPLRARPGGVLTRAGHTEAATDLIARLSDGCDTAVISELLDDAGEPLRGRALDRFAARHRLPCLTIADLIRDRRQREALVTVTGSAQLPTALGTFQAVAYRSALDGVEHLALAYGDVSAASASPQGVLTRVHSECLTGDLVGSQRCDCGQQFRAALEMIVAEGAGVVVYLRGHEGRGIGLGHKLRAYSLQQHGRDTLDANLDLGLPVDSRQYGLGASILCDLGANRIRVITNNPAKYGGLEGFGVELTGRVSIRPTVNTHNISYLQTKRDRMGHDLNLPFTAAASPPRAVPAANSPGATAPTRTVTQTSA